MALPQKVTYLTPQEYYRLERAAEYKSEYFNGEIFAMAGGTSRHSLVIMNLSAALVNALRGKRCTAYNGDQRLKIKSSGLRVYPDASVYCEPLECDPDDDQAETATNPTVVFEVLSDSTEAYDRGTKAAHYRSIGTLQAYVLISQNEPHVEHYGRQADGRWVLTEATDLAGTITIPSLQIELSLEDIYDKVEFATHRRT